MQIVSLKLLNFRNYNHLSLSFNPTMNIIYGNNGSGKTNLVEAIYVLALTKSFRGSTDKVLIQKDKNLTKISGVVLDNIKKNYQIVLTLDGKMVKIDSKRIARLSDYIAKMNVIIFHPDSLRLVKDSPSVRRDSLDIDIASFDARYLDLISSYEKLLKQRNAYLKTMYVSSNKSMKYLDILTDKLIDYGILIYDKRKVFLDKINEGIGLIYYKISSIDKLTIKYFSSYQGKSKEEISKMYQQCLEKDMLFGSTSCGIHHDDFGFFFDTVSLKDYASQGQQKNAIIAYKLREIEMFKEDKDCMPILILDDLFSELDGDKINNILNILDKDMQVFITITDLDKLSMDIKNKSKIFYCNDNDVREDL